MHSNRIWRPFTILGKAEEPLMVKSGKGIYLTLDDGRKVLDMISSWWVNLHGHAHPAVAEAVANQARELEHVIFAGFTHQPAEILAEKLLNISKNTFGHVFFSDNGSTSVEVALKMAYQYWQNLGETQRNTFISFEGAYHGDTVGAMSAGARSVFSEVFRDWMIDFERVPYPETWVGDAFSESKETEVLAQIRLKLEDAPLKYAAIIIEPLIQGAGGMRICRPEFLRQLEQVAKEYKVLIIYDEVMTGFGRTGDFFAWKKSETKPDILCLSKGLTGGFLPMAVTLTSPEVFGAFNSAEAIHTFWHGHSYTGNPLGCAAAVASLSLLEQNQDAFKNMEAMHLRNWDNIREQEGIRKARFCGTVAAFSIGKGDTDNYLDSTGPEVKKYFLDKNILVRPLGNVLYFMPPYCITPEELEYVYKTLSEYLESKS